MSVYPVALVHLERHRCVVVGGGSVAARKVVGLVDAGARPVVICPALCDDLERLAEAGRVSVLRREYRGGDLEGATLAISATDDADTNALVHAEAGRRGVLVNVADDPGLCGFHMPAIVRRGDLTIAISTGGGSPALARHIREVVEALIDSAYGELLAILAELRPRVLEAVPRSRQPALWSRLLDGSLLSTLRTRGSSAASDLAGEIVSSYCSPDANTPSQLAHPRDA